MELLLSLIHILFQWKNWSLQYW